MGNACDCLKMLHSPAKSQQKKVQYVPQTHRGLSVMEEPKDEAFQQTNEDRKHGMSDSSLSESFRADAKAFSRRQSSAQCSNFGDRKTSSIIQSYIDTSSIVIINPRSTINTTVIDSSQYYTLIDKVAFIRKTADRLKVTTPAGSSELNCQPQYLTSTLFIAEGIPLQTLPDVNTQKSFVQTDDSPIQLMVKLGCLECNKKVKLTFCKAHVDLEKTKCPKCEKVGKWSLLDIKANVPIWGEGRRIEDHESLETAPSQLRLIGCVFCFKFSELSRKLEDCDCYVCKNCDVEGEEIHCPICNSEDFLL